MVVVVVVVVIRAGTLRWARGVAAYATTVPRVLPVAPRLWQVRHPCVTHTFYIVLVALLLASVSPLRRANRLPYPRPTVSLALAFCSDGARPRSWGGDYRAVQST